MAIQDWNPNFGIFPVRVTRPCESALPELALRTLQEAKTQGLLARADTVLQALLWQLLRLLAFRISQLEEKVEVTAEHNLLLCHDRFRFICCCVLTDLFIFTFFCYGKNFCLFICRYFCWAVKEWIEIYKLWTSVSHLWPFLGFVLTYCQGESFRLFCLGEQWW